MLKFNLVKQCLSIVETDLNTSYVKVQFTALVAAVLLNLI